MRSRPADGRKRRLHGVLAATCLPRHRSSDDPQAANRDFQDTAAIMKCLDLVIAADTATAHLAGALAVPAWVPLSAVVDWRWMHRRDDSPWYPALRLFRQKTLGDWDEVFARIARELELRVQPQGKTPDTC
jgi:hypothetical protein